jgi:hypothetical protein
MGDHPGEAGGASRRPSGSRNEADGAETGEGLLRVDRGMADSFGTGHSDTGRGPDYSPRADTGQARFEKAGAAPEGHRNNHKAARSRRVARPTPP